MANIAQAEVNRVIDILNDHPGGLRLFQVARLLKLPHDHNYWQTYSLLQWMMKEDLIYSEMHHISLANGLQSKVPYRFYLFPMVDCIEDKFAPKSKLRYGWDRIIARFKSAFS
jgi:hypothetical protein